MARTSRNDPTLNALDDLNLDDMFEGGQDGLFDELGMDLGELGDITNEDTSATATSNASTLKKSGVPPVPKGLDDMKFDLLGDIGVDDGATSPAKDESQSPMKKSRRTTKRKIKGSPAFVDDEDDDDGPASKRRRYTKKTKSTTKTKDGIENSHGPSPKGKKSKTPLTIPTLERGGSQASQVAAAGQFGGRHKRGNFPLLARTTSKTKVKTNSSSGPISAAPVMEPQGPTNLSDPSLPQHQSLKRGRSLLDASKPIETLFCGLHSSDTTFYPFMSALPQEASMKKCSKHYSSLEKINASLASTTPGPDLDDALLNLLMFHDPVPTKEKKLIMAAAILSTRKLVSATDRQLLATDLASVTMLVKRQHDFLAQSLGNMERWCKGNFSGDDYRAVYGGEKPKSILAQLTSPMVRVRLRCAGLKETKLSTPLLANIPTATAIDKSAPSHSSTPYSSTSMPTPTTMSTTSTATTKKKQRNDSAAATTTGTTTTSTTATTSMVSSSSAATGTSTDMEESVSNYVDLPPNGRRQRILELIVRQATLLETKQSDIDETRRKILEKQNQALQKIVDDDDLVALNTTTLWKWADKSCYLSDFTEQDIRDLLVFQPEIHLEHLRWEGAYTNTNMKPQQQQQKPPPVVQESLYERLQSLLVDVENDDDDDIDDDAEEEEEVSEDDELWEVRKDTPPNDTADDKDLLDLRELSLEERAYLQLRAAGLLDESRPPPDSDDDDDEEKDDDYDDDDHDNKEHENGGKVKLEDLKGDDDKDDDDDSSVFDELLQRMKLDLRRIDGMNNSRMAFLEFSATAHLELSKRTKLQEDRNGQLISKYNQLLKKQKENKRSARQKLPRKDEDWVPW